MKIYTRQGDDGRTSLGNGTRVSKYDDRVELLGTIDELNSQIGLAKVISGSELSDRLCHIQRNLIHIMAGIADPRNQQFRFGDHKTVELEAQIDRLESSFPRPKEFVLYGGCEQSARLDVARAVARRAERRFHKISLNYGGDGNAMRYLNRLSDYLYVEARYADYLAVNSHDEELRQNVLKTILQNAEELK